MAVVAPPALRDLVESAGYPCWPGGEPPEETVAAIRERLPVASPAEASALANGELFGRLAARAMLPAVERACAQLRPDLVLREPCEYASAVVAAGRGVPVAQVAISLADVERGSIHAAAPALAEYRHGLAGEIWNSPYLTRFPASLDPSPFPATVRYRETAAAPRPAPPDWWEGRDAPLVYMTFGTVLGHMSVAAQVYRAALAAAEHLDARVLLTVGRAVDPSTLGPVPAHVRVERWVEQESVLAAASLVVCHAGSGTALAALSFGVPLVMAPLFADQHENARRIAAAGAGAIADVEGVGPPGPRRGAGARDAPRIARQIQRVLAEPSYRRRAQSVAGDIAAAADPADALGALLGPAVPPTR